VIKLFWSGYSFCFLYLALAMSVNIVVPCKTGKESLVFVTDREFTGRLNH